MIYNVFLFLIFLLSSLCAKRVITEIPLNQHEINTKSEKKDVAKKTKEILIDFSFNDENLVNIVNLLAEKKEINIVLPQGANAINQKITFNYPEKISLNKAWDFLLTFLNLSGYSLTLDETGIYTIVKTDANTVREPVPLFVGVNPTDLPNIDEKIRYVYYLNNVKVPAENASSDPINTTLKDILNPEGSITYDPRSNAVILSDNASNIASAMKIIVALDNTGYKEMVEVIPLYYANAENIVKLFKELIPPTPTSGFPLRSSPKTESNLYFSSGTNVFAYGKLNRLVLMGKDTSIQRIKDFIEEYIDVAPETGKSILHYYDLQYLESEELAKVLNNIIKTPEGQAQSQTIKEAGTGPERYFEGVVIIPEAIKTSREAQTVVGSEQSKPADTATTTIYQGGNRLIVAARESDWLRIKDLIFKLDKPQKQVILEVLILDITKTTDDLLGGDIRNKKGTFDSSQVQFLASNLTDVNSIYGGNATTPPPTPPATLTTDLLGYLSMLQNPNFAQGSLIMSFNDNSGSGIFSLLQVLKAFTNIKIVSHPFLVTSNNKKATVSQADIRRSFGNAEGTPTGGTITVNQVDIPAAIQVSVVPRISSIDRLNLRIDINIDQYVEATVTSTDLTRQTRIISTDANLGSGDVLALGGLLQYTDTEAKYKTPLLSQIPIIGWLFRSNQEILERNNLVVFICPTIVDIKFRSGLNKYTTDKIRKSDKDLDNTDVFDNQKDPITHLFFGSSKDDRIMVDQYLNTAKNSSIKPSHFRENPRNLTESRKESEACAVTNEHLPKEVLPAKKRNITPEPEREKIKELIAMEDNPFSSIQNVKS